MTRQNIARSVNKIIDTAYVLGDEYHDGRIAALVSDALIIAKEAGLFDYAARLDEGASMTLVVKEAQNVLSVIEYFPAAEHVGTVGT